MTLEKKAKLESDVNEVIEAIKTATTVEDLGRALNEIDNLKDEKDGFSGNFMGTLRLLGRKLLDVMDAEDSDQRKAVYAMVCGSMAYLIVLDNMDKFIEPMEDSFNDPDETHDDFD